MRNAPQTTDQAAESLKATKALFNLRERGHLYRAERRDFGWIAVTKQGAPPVVMYSPAGVMQFIEEYTQPKELHPVQG
ncbi:hypothetical protein [Streptomyces phaeochromogenes]